MKKSTADGIVNAFAKLKEQRDKSDTEAKNSKGKQGKLGAAVKKLTQAEFDALPKALQKELKEFR